jgi:hypothetical protein
MLSSQAIFSSAGHLSARQTIETTTCGCSLVLSKTAGSSRSEEVGSAGYRPHGLLAARVPVDHFLKDRRQIVRHPRVAEMTTELAQGPKYSG